jgi:hypothetical protein
VWPSASKEIRRELFIVFCSDLAQSYGVAGSRVVPIIKMGAVLMLVILFVARVFVSMAAGTKYLQVNEL